MLTSNIHILFWFIFLIGYSHQFENLIRKINDFYQCCCVVNSPTSQSLSQRCVPLVTGTYVDLLEVYKLMSTCRVGKDTFSPCSLMQMCSVIYSLLLDCLNQPLWRPTREAPKQTCLRGLCRHINTSGRELGLGFVDYNLIFHFKIFANIVEG